MENALVTTARMVAFTAHAAVGQKRKYTGDPYSTHLEEVVDILENVGGFTCPLVLASAYLHDVLEDTQVGAGFILDVFGEPITQVVLQLTDDFKPQPGTNRSERKARYAEQIAAASYQARVVKLADMLSNGRSIFAYDPEFAPLYTREMRHLLDKPEMKMTVGGGKILWETCDRMLRQRGF